MHDAIRDTTEGVVTDLSTTTWFGAVPEKHRWIPDGDSARDRVDARGAPGLGGNAAPVTARPSSPTKEPAGPACGWPDNCNQLSRVVAIRGNVKVHSKEKCVVLAEQNGWSVDRARGYVDGEICRQRAKKPSKYTLIGIDEYSLGFRAGYYERRNEAAITTERLVSSLGAERSSGVEISST